MIEPKPLSCRVRTLGWKPSIVIEPEDGGTLTFVDDQHRPGLFAFGDHHDYCIRIEDGIGRVGKWAEGSLYDGEPDQTIYESMAFVPGGTTTELIRIAESWETNQ